MNKSINLKVLHNAARQMKWYDFENWVANELFDIPASINSSELTNNLGLCDIRPKCSYEASYICDFRSSDNICTSKNDCDGQI